MISGKLSRREVLTGLASAALFPAVSAQAQGAASALCFTSAIEMARLIREKKLSAREALAEHLKQIERVNPKVNAIVTLAAELQAKQIVGRDKEDFSVLQLAHAFEEATGFGKRRPAIA
jgi:amidase